MDGSNQNASGMGTVQSKVGFALSIANAFFSCESPLSKCFYKGVELCCSFLSDYYVFIGLKTGKKVAEGIMRDGVYYLRKEEVDSAFAAVLSRTPTDEFMLQHRQLGHLSIHTVSLLSPKLFKAADKDKLICDACEFGKHTFFFSNTQESCVSLY